MIQVVYSAARRPLFGASVFTVAKDGTVTRHRFMSRKRAMSMREHFVKALGL